MAETFLCFFLLSPPPLPLPSVGIENLKGNLGCLSQSLLFHVSSGTGMGIGRLNSWSLSLRFSGGSFHCLGSPPGLRQCLGSHLPHTHSVHVVAEQHPCKLFSLEPYCAVPTVRKLRQGGKKTANQVAYYFNIQGSNQSHSYT